LNQPCGHSASSARPAPWSLLGLASERRPGGTARYNGTAQTRSPMQRRASARGNTPATVTALCGKDPDSRKATRMKGRLPEISDRVTLGCAERMLNAHRRYRKVGESQRPASARIRTAVEVTVMQLTFCLPRTSPQWHVPDNASRAYREVIRATTRRGADGKVSRKHKKRRRNDAYSVLVTSLDFLDSE